MMPNLSKMTIVVLLLGVLSAALLPGKVLGESVPAVQVTGVEGDVLDNVVEATRPPAGLASNGRINTIWLDRYLQRVPQQVTRALEPFGYYESRVDVDVDRDSEPMTIRIAIDPGPPVLVTTRHLEIVGERHPELLDKMREFPLAPGSELRHLPYEKAKAELLALAVDLGYLDATFSKHVIRVDLSERSCHVELVLETGPRYRFGPIRLTGTEGYPGRFVRRYLTVEAGDVFSYSELGRTQQRLLDSDRFENVVMTPHREDAEDRAIPVEIALKKRPSKRLRPGIGYGTDTGARFFLRYQDVNVWGLGHELSTDLQVAERQQNLAGTYLIPGYRNIDTMLALRGGYKAEDLDAYETRYVFAEAEQLYGFTERKVGSIFVRYQRETSTISGVKNTSLLLMPGLRFRIGKVDDPIRPKEGYRIVLEARGVWDQLASDLSVRQTLGDASWLINLPWRSTLLLRGSAAWTLQTNEFDELPASLRFFAGGDNSVRGYAYQSLGPVDAQGEVVGGKHLLFGSVELEKAFLKNWGAVVFYDVGNAFNSFDNFDLAESAGVGLRYYTLVGPIRVDVAKPINDVNERYRLHVGLGVRW